MRGDILYLLLVIAAFRTFITVVLWLQVTDARHRQIQAEKKRKTDITLNGQTVKDNGQVKKR